MSRCSLNQISAHESKQKKGRPVARSCGTVLKLAHLSFAINTGSIPPRSRLPKFNRLPLSLQLESLELPLARFCLTKADKSTRSLIELSERRRRRQPIRFPFFPHCSPFFLCTPFDLTTDSTDYKSVTVTEHTVNHKLLLHWFQLLLLNNKRRKVLCTVAALVLVLLLLLLSLLLNHR